MVAGFDNLEMSYRLMEETRNRGAEAKLRNQANTAQWAADRQIQKMQATINQYVTAINNYASLLQKEQETNAQLQEATKGWKQAAVDQCSRADVYQDFIKTIHERLRVEIETAFGSEGAAMIDEWLEGWKATAPEKYAQKRMETTKEFATSTFKPMIMPPRDER